MMRNVFNFLLPLLVIACLFIGTQIWQKNYNVAYNESAIGEGSVKDKEFLPAGNYMVNRVVGQQIRAYETWMPDRYIIKLVFEGENFKSTVSQTLYDGLVKRDLVDIWYETPAYWGAAFNVHILDPNKPNQFDDLEATRTAVINYGK